MDLMADWAICLAVNVTNAQPESEKRNISWFMQSIQRKILLWQNFSVGELEERISADNISLWMQEESTEGKIPSIAIKTLAYLHIQQVWSNQIIIH